MMKFNKICLTAFIGLTALGAMAQEKTVTINSPGREIVQKMLTPSALKPETKEKLVTFLKTMSADIGALGLPQNRVRYATDAAELLWQHDEKAARAMYASAGNDLRFLIQQLDEAELKRQNGESDDLDFFFGGGGGQNSAVSYSMQNIRRELILSLASHDADAALALFNETRREDNGSGNDRGLETQLTTIIANNDATKGYELAMQKLSKNRFDGLGDIAAKIFAKDAEKGAKLAAEIIRKLKSSPEAADDYSARSTATTLFIAGAQMLDKKDQKAIFLSASEMRELGEIVANNLIKNSEDNGYFDDNAFESVSASLKKYAPAAHRRVKRTAGGEAEANFTVGENVIPAPEFNTAPVEVSAQIGAPSGRVGRGINSGIGTAIVTASPQAKTQTERDVQQALFAELMRLIASPDAIDLGELRKNLTKLKNKPQKLMILTQIAKILAKRGDKDAAKSLLAENSDVIVTNPRKAGEMIQGLMLVDAYAEVEPERAFVLLEAMITEINPIISSVNRIGEFVGFQEFTSNGEFNMGSLPKELTNFGGLPGGNSANALLQPTLVNLAEADFERFVGLTNKFERGEIRLEAKMLIIKTLMPPASENSIGN